MRHSLRRLVLALAAFSACTGAAEPAPREPETQLETVAPDGPSARPALWKIADEDTTIYLFGTVHALPAGTEWYGGKVADSFEHSQELVTEILESSGEEARSAVMAKALLPANQSLRSLMSPAERTAYEQALAREGLQPAALDRFKPWWGAVFLATVPILKQGYDPKNGVEALLDAKAKSLSHPHSALETAEYQLGLFDSLPQEVQLRYLAEVVRTMPDARNELEGMIAAWKKGDADELAKLMNEDEDEPALMEKLLYARNKNWAQWIRTRLDRPGTVFIAVGAGHLAGAGSVQDDLRAMGIASTRIQ